VRRARVTTAARYRRAPGRARRPRGTDGACRAAGATFDWRGGADVVGWHIDHHGRVNVSIVDPGAADLRARLQAALGTAYTLERELGGGGMARVFVAEETALGRHVVVKVLPPETSGVVSAERFRREVQLAARLQHPHVVPLLSAGEGEGLLYYTMPFVAGETLRARLARTGALPLPAAVALVRDVARALAYAHRHGVVHRDVKPENVLLGEDGDALVADFGVAKALVAATGTADGGPLTAAGLALGTPAYMAPEQALGDPATDHRADLYALGVVAYEALAGSHPFAGRPAQAMVAAHATESPDPLCRRRASAPPELAALVMRLLEKHPADRPTSADDVLRALALVSAAAGIETASTGRAGTRRRAALAAGLGLVLLAGGAAYTASRAGRNERVPAGVLPVARPSATVRPSVAVLPFANTSGDAADEHFSDGLTDELIGALSQVGSLKVIGRTSSFALKGKALDVRTVGDTLHVAAVLEGSIRRSGDRLRVTAQLVGTRDADVLWAQTFDREPKDVFAVQEEIARAIVVALRVTLAAGAAGGDAPLVRPATADLAAYDLYLRGRLFFNQRTGPGLARAVTYFEQAVARDPAYARAYAGLADAHMTLMVNGYRAPRDAVPRARAAAERALALDSTIAEAHVALARVRFAYDWAAGGRELDRAVALDPNYALGRQVRGIYLLDRGRLAEAEAALREGLVVDPLSAPIRKDLGRVYLSAHRPDQAVAELRDALELNPLLAQTHLQLGHARLQQRRPAEAVAAFRQAAALGSVSDSAYLAYGLAAAGRRAEARAVLRALLATADSRYLPPVGVAAAYTGLGDADAAFRWLERGARERAAWMDALNTIPAFAPIHADPRWRDLVRRVVPEP
jgi:serine/threonine-protein kinase